MTDGKDIERLLLDYFAGTLDARAQREVEEWINGGGDNYELALQIQKLSEALTLESLSEEVDTEEKLASAHRRMRRTSLSRFAASVRYIAAALTVPLLLLSSYLAYRLHQESRLSDSEIVLSTGSGMTSCTELPDGSRVWLNSNSTLSYPSKFARTRVVKLDGEGFFQVAKTPRKDKFIVRASGVDVEVLGTEFDVEAYSGYSSEVRTTLVNGSVAMKYSDRQNREHEVLMKPGERYTYNRETAQLEYSKVNTSLTASWKDGKITLDNTSLEEALRTIGNHYNAEFIVQNPKLLKNRYTGTFKGQRLEVILEHFARTTDMKFEFAYSRDAETVDKRQIILVR